MLETPTLQVEWYIACDRRCSITVAIITFLTYYLSGTVLDLQIEI